MNFSFVLPSRGKIKDLKKMFDSFERTTRYLDKLEFLIALDVGFKDNIDEFIIKQEYSFDIRTFERPKTKDFTNDYYNWLANKTRGSFIIAFNDDAWMRTSHWDEKILRIKKDIGWSIFMLDIPDTARIKYRNMFPCFPMVTRRAFLTLGFLLPPMIRMYPADKVIHAIYESAGRIIPVRNIMIEHEHIVESDKSKKELLDIYLQDKESQKTVDVSEYVHKLLIAGNTDGFRKKGKIERIINIIKE